MAARETGLESPPIEYHEITEYTEFREKECIPRVNSQDASTFALLSYPNKYWPPILKERNYRISVAASERTVGIESKA